MRVLRWLAVLLFLGPLVARNYRMRREGRAPDEWYWADVLMLKWAPGLYTKKMEGRK